MRYAAVPAQVDLPKVEHEILDFWAKQEIFTKTLEKTKDGQPWTFYEGPPTANGMPGTHHIEARVFKDVFPRFKTMQGYRVDRKAGWDCHGLPVELAVEKELGFNGKPDIEAYGVEPFNKKCRESVSQHVDAFAELTQRMGYWVNMDEAYWTMSTEYVESCWWALKTIFDKGLLVEDYRVAPYCPRCGTALSDHELAQGYEDVTDPSVFVRFPVISGPLANQADLLVWTTTPWTLASNIAVAVHPEVTYLHIANGETKLVIAEPLLEKVLGEDSENWEVLAKFQGAEMEHWQYQRPLEIVELPAPANYIVLADYVTTEDGTGLVHQAPAFGEDDMLVCRRYGLPFVNPIRPDGNFAEDLDLIGGLFFKAADPVVVENLQERGLMFRVQPYEHSYPHCWRCHTALLYYAQPSWYIKTTKIKDALLQENANTTWYPAHIKEGRFGDWLENNIDWALSRSRYWGTPLPIWRNDEDPSKLVCIASRAELGELAGLDLSNLDPHRPFIDEITFQLPGESGTYRRVPEVIDAWFDSGSMPFAQWGYPHVPGSKEKLAAAYPADFICEAIDQTRGWFYSLMAVGTLVFEKSSYQNVLCLGHILAEDGRKMSKHLGNILEPIPLMDKHGADAVRWFMAAGGSPWASRRVGHGTIQETVRKVLLTYWNTVAFQALYARTNNWEPAPAPSSHVLDRWLVAKRSVLIEEVTAALHNFDTQRTGILLSDFIDELSNWYVRRSRRRFWDGEPGALWTLHETLEILTRLLAPITPFITEKVWQDLFAHTSVAAPESVHLASWPVVDTEIDRELIANMELTRRLVELGRSARSEAKVKTRQPLARVLIPSASFAKLDEELLAEIAQELNVETVESFASAGDLVDYSAKANFRALGKRFGKETPQVAAAIAEADVASIAAAIQEQGFAEIAYGAGIKISAEEVIISERPQEGWSLANEQGETVALDLTLTPGLRLAGLARDAIRVIQEARKASGLEVSDRIALTWEIAADCTNAEELAQAMVAHQDLIAEEVLALEVYQGTGELSTDLGLKLSLQKLAH